MNRELDLNQLTMDDIDFKTEIPKVTKKLDILKKKCKEQYGTDWQKHYEEELGIYKQTDTVEEIVNECIYAGHRPFINGSPEAVIAVYKRYEEKLKLFFGHRYKKHINHQENNPKINKLLVKDALKTGKWKELPKELHEEYHRMAGEKK